MIDPNRYYDAFAAPGFPRGLFNTRTRAEHSRKRKIVSHAFAPKSIKAFEPMIIKETSLHIQVWDDLCVKADEAGDEAHGLKG